MVEVEVQVEGSGGDLGARFEIGELIAASDARVVHRAFDRHLGRKVVLKRLAPAAQASVAEARRLRREARIGGQLVHPNVALVRDLIDGPHPAIVFEPIEGRTLADIIQGPQSLALPALLSIATQAAEALAALHRQRYLHRDVTPSNFMLSPGGELKLIDFGLTVSLDGDDDEGKTTAGAVAGTPGYIAPEVLQGQPPDPRSDLFSLGVVLFQLAARKHPFGDGDGVDSRVVTGHPAVLTYTRPDLPVPFDSLLLGLLAGNPSSRLPTAEALSRELSRVSSSLERSVSEGASELSGFQGLAPFGESDHKRFFGRDHEAADIVARVERRESRPLVLWGESGSGKTSLLRAAVIPTLRAHGYLPIYLRGYRDPVAMLLDAFSEASYEPPLPGEEPPAFLARLAGGPWKPVVLVFDQLEELFLAVESEEGRDYLLQLITTCCSRQDARIRTVFAIRADFLYLVPQSLGPRIPQLLSDDRLYPLRNLEQRQATVVLERSSRDGLEPSLVQTLVAELAVRRLVLPTELQIVGEQVQRRGIRTVAEYRRAGGKQALVRDYLAGAIEATANPDDAKRFLLSLISDDNTNQPRTVAEIARFMDRPQVLVEELAERFRVQGFVRPAKREATTTYELMHEYLVGLVQGLAGVQATPTQRANRLLRRYLAEQARDGRARIPLRQLWTIRRHADLVIDHHARRLLRTSLWSGLRLAAAQVVIVASVLGTISLWLSTSERWEMQRLGERHGAAVRRLAFAPDGSRLVSGSEDGTAAVWDFPRRRLLRRLSGHRGWVRSVAYSPDGRWIATAADDGVRVWNASTLTLASRIEPRGRPLALLFTADTLVLAGEAGTELVRLGSWQTRARLPVRTTDHLILLAGKQGEVFPAALDWTLATGHDQARAGPGLSPALGGTGAAVTASGDLLVTVDSSGVVRFIDPGSGRLVESRRAHRDNGRSVAVSRDGRRVATGAEDIVLWDLPGRQLRTHLSYGPAVWDLAFTPDGKQLCSGHADGTIQIWDAEEPRHAASLTEHSGGVSAVAFSGDGRWLATASDDRSVIVWNALTGQKRAVMLDHRSQLMRLAFAAELVVSCDQDGEVIAWHPDGPRVLWRRRLRYPQCWSLAASADGARVATPNGVLDARTGGPLATFEDLPGGLAFTPDGQRLASSSAAFPLALRQAPHWKIVARRDLREAVPRTLAMSSDGLLLASGDNLGQARLWSIPALEDRGMIGRHSARIRSVAFLPDDRRRVATAGDDAKLAIWRWDGSRAPDQPGAQRVPVLSIAFAPLGDRMATGEDDASVRVYRRRHLAWGWEVPAALAWRPWQ